MSYKTIYGLKNCTLAPWPSGKALNLAQVFALPKANLRRFVHTNTGTFSEHHSGLGDALLLIITLI